MSGVIHLGRYTPSREDIYIMGYNPSANQILAVFPDYLRQEQRNALRDIIMSTTAQNEDYLAKILQNERFVSDPSRVWLDVLFNDMFKKGSKAVRHVSLKDVEFENESQGAFFRGYGDPINPENSKKNKNDGDAPAINVDDIVAKVSQSFEDRYGELLLKQAAQIAELTSNVKMLATPVVAPKPKTTRKPKKTVLAETITTTD